jgi:subtilisin
MTSEIQLPEITIHARYSATALSEQIPWSLKDFGVPEAWKKSRGKGILIGIVDTGIDSTHIEKGDLDEAIEDARDFSGSKFGPKDVMGHGTHVAGIVGAREGNAKGIAGVAPDCKLIIAKGLSDEGGGSAAAVASAIAWCVDRGCHIINCSLGAGAPDAGMKSAIDHASHHGTHVIAAAGNTGRLNDVNYPARFDNVIAVAALDRFARLASFSSRGPQIDVAWPGQQIISTYLNGSYASLSGTSMAAPGVAGLVALRLAWELANGGITTKTTAQLLEVLQHSSKDLGTPGIDSETGWGVVVPGHLMPDVAPTPIPPPTGKGITVFIPGGMLVPAA